MARIKPLPPDLISQIAAGEVIERPAYAIKELIENSIDALATSIKIELYEAGLEKIVITDNGEGMDQEDIAQCFKPHTTSKIYTPQDLLSIRTMGFRGEALSSLASISNMTIRSRSENQDLGTQVVIKNSIVNKISSYGMPQGTQIIIEDIFATVPVRKKFLTNSATELRLIIETVTAAAIAYPKIEFQLSHNRRQIISLSAGQSSLIRSVDLLGKDALSCLLALSHEESYLKVSGFIAKPQLSSRSTSRQLIYINSRKIADKNISSAVKEAYGTLLEQKFYPVFILFVEIPHERVDVNVHPRKDQVAFIDEKFVLEVIKNAVVKKLSKENLIYTDRRWQKGQYQPNIYNEFTLRDGGTATYAGRLIKENTTPWSLQEDNLQPYQVQQIHNLYLIVQTTHGMKIVDQHAAHERILYEQYIEEFQKEKDKRTIYSLAKPYQLDLSVTALNNITEKQSDLEEIGFKIDLRGETPQLLAVPDLFKDRDYQNLIEEFLEDINQYRTGIVDNTSHKMISYLACRAAIKAGDKLTATQALNLINKLNECKNKFTCPHGRPIVIEYSLNELHHSFHRR